MMLSPPSILFGAAYAIIIGLSCQSTLTLARPLIQGLAPAALSNSDQCADGSCQNNDGGYGGGGDYNHGDRYGNAGWGDDDDDDDEEEELPSDSEVLSKVVPHAPDHLYDILSSTMAYDLLHRHMERALITKTFPDALNTTLRSAGNYSDGTPAGTPTWVGDVGAQDSEDPTYASFGSVLDISLSSKMPMEGGSISWLASLIHREALVAHRWDSSDTYIRPCRTDLLDDYDADDDYGCTIGATMGKFVSVRVNQKLRQHAMKTARAFDILRKGDFHVGLDKLEAKGRKFDTIIADGVLSSHDENDDVNDAIPDMHDMDLMIERLTKFLKPGGTLYIMGDESVGDSTLNIPAAEVHRDVNVVMESLKSLAGDYPKRNLPATWVHRTTSRLGLNVFSSTVFQKYHSIHDMSATIREINDWIDYLDLPDQFKNHFYQLSSDLQMRVEEIFGEGEPMFAGSHSYIIAAELLTDTKQQSLRGVDGPSEYQHKEKYRNDHNPKVEELAMPHLEPGVMEEYHWANGDPYDGVSARIGLPPKLVETLTEYVKELGLWDLMVDTITKNPMPQDSTRFYSVKSPYIKDGKNFTWSAKRPDNFYGSDSDMHWFDIADEAAHEDSLRALAKGGFDEVLKAIGNYLGLDHLVTFSIGLLAVTKSDKGYIHVDFSNSDKKAFNFLINLQTPGDDPELTVIEEDELGNRRRGQVKYAPTFGVLNGDDAMHATNECNHRASGGVRITASIFISELDEASLEQVASHDKYYFPFGNMDWIWAQRGRHWNRDGSVSLVNDKGRRPFEAKDKMEGCEESVGEDKAKCLEHGQERMLCYKTCGAFMTDDDFRPGEERQTVFGW